MSETLIETADLRVVLVADYDADEPYNDGGSPILRLDADGRDVYGDTRKSAEQTGGTSYVVHERIIEAAEKWATSEPDVFERYLRVFHGVTDVVWFGSHSYQGGYSYVSFDPADWRESMGLTTEHLAAHPGIKVVNVDEYQAHLDGDVYGYVVEEREVWDTRNSEGAIVATMETWETVDSCFGFYGHKYAEEEARRAFASEAAERGIEVDA